MTEVEALRERVRELEAALGLVDPALIKLDLSPALRKIMGLMMQLPHVTPVMIEERLGIATTAKVAIHRLRHKLKPHGIEIKSRHCVGYWLEPDMKDKIKAIITANSNEPHELSA
jgi:hypothetical protein